MIGGDQAQLRRFGVSLDRALEQPRRFRTRAALPAQFDQQGVQRQVEWPAAQRLLDARFRLVPSTGELQRAAPVA